MSKKLWQTVDKPSKGKLGYVEEYARGKTLLDIGCAQGWYAKRARELGFEVLATDIEDFMIVEGVKFQKIAPDQIDPGQGQKFDTVLMFDVLEHIKDEARALSELTRICKKRLILSVPNADDRNLPDYNLTLVNRKDMTHQRYYTPDDLCRKLEKYGFDIVKLSYEGAVLPGVLGEFIWPRWLGHVFSTILNKLFFAGILKSPYWGDIYVVADKGQ